ncbi:hypothetical protein ABB37_10093 [Leptomonas pyrrhocoris]|uniref:BSD domain-containing protein n=1 Tax=Leptomonas pyrrhocoris TaxID=157538 RepID=A0A0M9FP11_LEPPY|nr:hypothetical protein ABB37_10093 [Leptomonas pyrrhocoris]KPA73145.1 hypothetical protein ABB37_10093 [Leptomonas pyrrhocoris]|eukprot:XP_015651584.1 hypothetical protein ABB37_10093 [Leptomonas pyrrhocoris]
MSSAEFVRNPDVHTAVYRWEATGIDELTRQNKLTSLPFWVPNAMTRHHQFKLVLLRGLVPSADPANDALGLIVELIPPPPSPAAAGEGGAPAASAAATTSPTSASDFPGGCAVTCEVLPLDAMQQRGATSTEATPSQQQQQQQRAANEKAFCSTKTAVVDADNTQISFPDLIPAAITTNAHYVSGTVKSLTLQITIETGISVPLHQVATTAYSFFSSLSSSVSQLLGTTTHLVHEGRENLNAMLKQATNAAPSSSTSPSAAEAAPTSAAPQSSSSSHAGVAEPPPWEKPPEEWRSRPDAWRSLLCDRLARLDGTYRHGVERTLSCDDAALLAEVGLSESDLWSLYSLFDSDRDVHEALLTAAVVRAQRYALVPAKLKEETFWANYFWKAHCVGICVTERQVSAVIAVLCTPSRAADTDASASVKELLRRISDATEIHAVMSDFIERNEAGEPWCAVVAETARRCAAVLQASSAQRTDLSQHTMKLLTKTLGELRATLSRYRTALSTPPSTPATVPATPPSSPVVPADATASVDVAAAPSGAAQRAATPAPLAVETTAIDAAADAVATETRNQSSARETASPPRSPTADAPAPVLESAPPRPEAVRSGSRIEFAKMPWEEEDS